jgi:transposase DDE domain
MGWFFGFKLHIIIDGRGRIVQWKFTQANEDNSTLLKDNMFTVKTIGKLVVDKGYTAQNLFENY